jgi:predicted secreted Zn-dependent protease
MGNFRISIVIAFATLMGPSLDAQPAPARVGPANALAELPGTHVDYYEVTGTNVTEINRSIARQRPRSPKGNPVPASTDWSVQAEFDRTVTNGHCRVTGARASVTTSADLPRLAVDARIDKPTRARWHDYVGLLEQNLLATLAFVYQNLGTVERAMLASDCDSAKSVGAAAIEQLRVQTARLEAEREKRLAERNELLSEFRPAVLRVAKVDCRNVDVVGSRLRSFRLCMPIREWERLHDNSEEYVAGVQNNFSKREPF